MRIALFGRTCRPAFREDILQLFGRLRQYDSKIIIYKPFFDFLGKKIGYQPEVHGFFTGSADVPDKIDFVLSIGGDGTFLAAVSIVRNRGIPIIGINTGRLGFLANIAKSDIGKSISALFSGEYVIEKRSLLEIRDQSGLLTDLPYAINEVTIQKKNSAMITIKTHIDDAYLNAYWADGLIISTPTGSTAYSLSVGGPVVTPDSSTLIICPIAPHNLTVRPVVVPDTAVIRMKTSSKSGKFLLTMDSRSELLSPDREIIIRKADFSVSTVRIEGKTFYDTLRNKLMWGVDKRN